MSGLIAVASWMVAKLDTDQTLHQDEAAFEIQDRFGEEFVYINANGNLAIKKEVLKAFEVLTRGRVVSTSPRY